MCFSVVQAEDRAQFEILKSQMYAERAAKRDRKPKRARVMPEDEPEQTGAEPPRLLSNHSPRPSILALQLSVNLCTHAHSRGQRCTPNAQDLLLVGAC